MPKDATIEDLDELHRQARTARSSLEPVWYMNLAYFEGRQWLAYGGGRLYMPQMPRSRILYVDNRIQPIVRKELARLTKNRPVFNVIPNSADEEDQNAAQLGNDIMTYLWQHLKLDKIRMRALRWSRICCAGFIKVFWDPTIGSAIEVLAGQDGSILEGVQGGPVRARTPEAQMAQQMAQSSGQELVVRRISQGDIRCEVRSPFQIFPDPLADSFEEVEWLIEESIKSKEYVRRRYGITVEADTPANPGLVQARMGGWPAHFSGGYKGVRIREYWCKPNSEHPNGYRVTWVAKGEKGQNGQQLTADEQPFDPMPYVMFNCIPVPGRLFGTSVTEQARGPQTELNKVRSQMAENRNRVGNPTVLASKQAVQDAEKFTQAMTLPGGVAFFDDGGSPNAIPSFLQAPDLPAYVVQEPAMIEASLQEISGQHEVTNAQVPPGVTAAAAIELLQEADETMIAPDVAEHEEELEQLGEKLLALVGRYYTDARTIEIGGDNAAWEIFDFRGSMLRGNTRLRVQAGSAFPRSKAARQAQMETILTYLAQSGQPLQGRPLAQFFEDYGLGNLSRFLQQFTDTETQCNRENALMAQGMILSTNDYDDDQGHIENHESFQRQPRYAVLTQRDPRLGQIFEMHVDSHRHKLAILQQQQAQAQLEAAGNDPQQQARHAQQDQQLQFQQAQQSQQIQGAQAQQQMALKAQEEQQQQQISAAETDQRLQQQAETHQQKMQQQAESHAARLQQQEQSHMVRMQMMAEQAQQRAAAAAQQRAPGARK
jgi:hypothetical protein